jgi:hypothetical protein
MKLSTGGSQEVLETFSLEGIPIPSIRTACP